MGCGSSVPHKSGFTSSAVSEKEAPPTPLLVGNGERDGSGWKGSDHAGRKYTKEEDNAALPSSSPKAVARDKTPSPKAFRDRRSRFQPRPSYKGSWADIVGGQRNLLGRRRPELRLVDEQTRWRSCGLDNALPAQEPY